MNVTINKPIFVYMESVEQEEYLGSMKMCVKIVEEHPTGQFLYEAGDIWFLYSRWDDFIKELASVPQQTARLADANEFFILEIQPLTNEFRVSLTCKEEYREGTSATLSFRTTIDFEDFYHIRNEFLAFEKWWW